MERLTRKSLEYKDTWIADGFLSNIDGVVRGKAIDKLAEFEDFMEENGFESLKDLQTHINKINKYELGIRKQFVKEINEEDFFDMKEENQALKDRWQRLKEWVQKQSKPIDDIVISDDETKYIYMSDIFDEMQELEKEIK